MLVKFDNQPLTSAKLTDMLVDFEWLGIDLHTNLPIGGLMGDIMPPLPCDSPKGSSWVCSACYSPGPISGDHGPKATCS